MFPIDRMSDRNGFVPNCSDREYTKGIDPDSREGVAAVAKYQEVADISEPFLDENAFVEKDQGDSGERESGRVEEVAGVAAVVNKKVQHIVQNMRLPFPWHVWKH